MGIFSTNQHSQAGRMPMTARFWPPAAGLTVVHLAVCKGHAAMARYRRFLPYR